MMPPRLDISPDQIALVVARFYAAIRRHPVLGPVFAAHVTDWPAHEAKIAAFWRNAILYDRGYEGSPMAAHNRAGNIRADHFPLWLGLFDQVLAATLPAQAAAGWSALARRIGTSLRMGLADAAPGRSGPPVLR
ncbi:MAG: group III truncated hemoglobin [Paracoccaceae bacterium]